MLCLFPSSPTRVDGGQGETIAYWDPQVSTKKKWEETYATELQSRGLTQDFTGLSTLLLGQAQPAQFQTEGQTGYWWGSKVSDDGNWTALDAVTNNANAEMPRSYYSGKNTYGAFYNSYAAFTESVTYSMTSGTAADSLCPKGWMLPTASGDPSWYNLLQSVYELAQTEEDVVKARSLPISLVAAGILNESGNRIEETITSGHFTSSYQEPATVANSIVRRSFTAKILTRVSTPRYIGRSIRCVVDE